MDIRTSLAAQQYATARPATEPKPEAGGQPSAFGAMATGFVETMKSAEETAKATMMGDADPHTLVQALAQTELAVEAAVTVRDRVVEAYQEILRMPV